MPSDGRTSAPTTERRARTRRLWQLFESIHAITYFSDETTDAYRSLGLKGFWQGYFASRVAPMGPVGGEVCAALFYNFRTDMATRALPSAWTVTTPRAVLDAREDALRGVLEKMFAGAQGIDEAADLLAEAASGASVEGRPLFAGHRALHRPDDPVSALWWGSTLLREHRGDGHVAALVTHGIGGLDANVLFVGTGRVPREVLQVSRSWSDSEWDSALRRLAERGLLDGDELTPGGAELRQEIEDTTDDLAAEPWDHLGEQGTERVVELLTPLRERVLATRQIPFFNPIGLPMGHLS